MDEKVPPTPPSSPSLYGEKVGAGNNYFYALAHWCNKTNRWIMAIHKFITNKIPGSIIGQFITSTWFDCYIYTDKIFLIICVDHRWSLEEIEKKLNNPTSLNDMRHIFRTIDYFTIPNLNKYLYTKNEALYIVLKSNSNNNNTMSIKIHKIDQDKNSCSLYATLPTFNFKID